MESVPGELSVRADGNSRPVQPEEQIDVSLSPDKFPSLAAGIEVNPFRRDEIRERGARSVAFFIFSIFGLAIFGLLVLAGMILWMSASPEDAMNYAQALKELLQSATTFLSGLFGPVLGFVLGYYFSEKQQKR